MEESKASLFPSQVRWQDPTQNWELLHRSRLDTSTGYAHAFIQGSVNQTGVHTVAPHWSILFSNRKTQSCCQNLKCIVISTPGGSCKSPNQVVASLNFGGSLCEMTFKCRSAIQGDS